MRSDQTKIAFETAGLKKAYRELELKQIDYESTNATLRNEQQSLKQSQSALKARLDQVRGSRRLLELEREQNARAVDAIGDMIESAAKGTPIVGTPLNLIKGSLPWPVAGSLLERFGRTRNEKLDTFTDNPGIDVKCGADSPVKSIAPGRVSVTWLRGFGNVCIVEHPGSYYTVYARLGQITVKPDEVVTENSVVGFAGYDPATEEYRVHFEIWDRREKQDPLTWLKQQ